MWQEGVIRKWIMMNLAELLKQTAEENQTRKILAILEESESLEDAKEKVKALLNK